MIVERYADYDEQGRVGLFQCECGCGQEFFRHYRTRPPQYISRKHRARAYRARAYAEAAAYDHAMEIFGPAVTNWHGFRFSFKVHYDRVLAERLAMNRGKE